MADSSDRENPNQTPPQSQPQPAQQVRTAGPRVAPAATPPGGSPAAPGAPAGPGSANPPQSAPRVAGAQGGFIVAPPPQQPAQQPMPQQPMPQQQGAPGYPQYPNYPQTPGYGVPQQGNTPPAQRQLGAPPSMGTPGAYSQPGAPNYPNYPQQYPANMPQQQAISPQFVTPTYAPNAPSPYRQQGPRMGQPMPSPYPPAPHQGQPSAQPRYGAPMPQAPAAPVMSGGPIAAYELRNIHFRYPGAQFELYVPQLSIPAGRLIYIGGEAGCGKSTLMKLLALQTKPNIGDIWLLGMHTTSLLDSQLDDVRGGGIVYVPQGDLGLTDHVPVEGIKRLLHDFDGLSWDDAERRALMGLQAAQFPAGRLGVKASNLSGGEKARVAIGKVYATQRPICLTDEVLGPLNERLRLKVVELFQQLADQGFTVICIEHQPQLQKYFDQVVTLDQGHIESVVDTRNRPREKVPPTPPTP